MPIIATLGLPALFDPSNFLISSSEVNFFKSLGVDTTRATLTANAWFKTLFVDTGLVALFHSTFNLPTLETKSALQVDARSVTSGWSDGLWNILFRAFWRLAALWPIYVSGLICFVLPSFVDGLSIRAIKKYNFQVHNPIFFSVSMHFAAMIAGLAIFIPFLPITLSAVYIGLFFVALAGAVWILASNFQSGV